MGLFGLFGKKKQEEKAEPARKAPTGPYSDLAFSASEMFTAEEIAALKPNMLRIWKGADNIYDTYDRVFTNPDAKVNGETWDILAGSMEDVWFSHGLNKTEINLMFVDRVRGYLTGKLRGNYAAEAAGASATGTGAYTERDNVGTRQETMSQAIAYWMAERPGLSVKPPFTLFTFPSANAAREALLEMPFIHRAEDSGKLICDRLMTFGYYETTVNAKPSGEYETLIAGSDFSLDEYRLAEEVFAKHGGTCKSHQEPDPSVRPMTGAGDASSVKYSETVKGNDGVSVYEVYRGPDRASAIAFLKTKPVDRKLYYIVVDTPDGSIGRDINGFYQE